MDDQIYEINIKRFIQSTDFQLKKLSDCINRLHEFQSYEDWANVKQAQLNASQIIKRIKSDIKEIEKIRGQVVINQENRSKPLVEKIDQQLKEITQRLRDETDEIDALAAPYHRVELKNQSLMIESSYDGPELYNYQVERDEFVAQDKDLCHAYEQLQKDCEDLKYIMEAFSHELFKQRETIDSIERNVESTQENIDSGSHSLRKALTYKSLGTAAGGAVIGTLVGGPVGFIAGAKLGAVVGVSGGLAGYFFGKYINTPSQDPSRE